MAAPTASLCPTCLGLSPGAAAQAENNQMGAASADEILRRLARVPTPRRTSYVLRLGLVEWRCFIYTRAFGVPIPDEASGAGSSGFVVDYLIRNYNDLRVLAKSGWMGPVEPHRLEREQTASGFATRVDLPHRPECVFCDCACIGAVKPLDPGLELDLAVGRASVVEVDSRRTV